MARFVKHVLFLVLVKPISIWFRFMLKLKRDLASCAFLWNQWMTTLNYSYRKRTGSSYLAWYLNILVMESIWISFTTSIWSSGHYPTSLDMCVLSLGNMQTYHSDRFTLFFYHCMATAYKSHVGHVYIVEVKLKIPLHDFSSSYVHFLFACVPIC
jgi:hypothetical protein